MRTSHTREPKKDKEREKQTAASEKTRNNKKLFGKEVLVEMVGVVVVVVW